MKHQDRNAEETLRRIRGTDDVSAEMREIKASLEEESESKGGWKERLYWYWHRKALFIGCMLQLFQQLCGINTVIYYSATILKSAGFDSKMAIWLSCIPASVNFLATFIGLWAVESLGRKLILAFSFLAISVALFILCFGFAMAQAESPTTSSVHEKVAPIGPCYAYDICHQCTKNADCGFCYLTNNFNSPTEGSCVPVSKQTTRFALHGRCALNSTTNGFSDHKALFTYEFCPSVYAYFAVAGLILFVLGFAPGAGPMPWTINAEIYPLWCRGVASSLSTVTNWTCNLVVSYTFLTLIDAITIWGTFLTFAGVSIFAASFVFMVVPETKDKSLEEIQFLFMSKDEREEQMEKKLKRESSKIGLGRPVMIRPLTKPHSDGTTELL
ncbi:unnamed protein product [Lymnaea stagnalis]|uniref:Major facilitator superfamily (MFS) profile domain-containing protein n=1 Tax=Lymnaea stagnalis TaxID=6523 RepID=A0AAV2HM73_LYMST